MGCCESSEDEAFGWTREEALMSLDAQIAAKYGMAIDFEKMRTVNEHWPVRVVTLKGRTDIGPYRAYFHWYSHKI